jgi:hypothetical protein
MKKVIVLLSLLLCFSVMFAQDRSIGLRLGDPTGITYKKYLRNNKGFEFGIGSAGAGWRNNYYRNSFGAHDPFNDYRYRSHTVQSTLFLQGRYLLHDNIYVQGLEGKWDWYWGVGAMLKLASIKYRFDDTAPPFKQSEVYHDVDFGPEGIAGMEYTFQDIPLTIFAEISLMFEIVDRVTLQPYSGVGARYRF